MTKVAFVIFSDPANYPPLMNAAREFSDAGWSVTIFGIQIPGIGFEMDLRADTSVVKILIHGGRFRRVIGTFMAIIKLKRKIRDLSPDLIYLHDATSCMVGPIATALGVPLIYHEHDTPRKLRLIKSMYRRNVFNGAEAIVVPNINRIAKAARVELKDRLIEVWNCPSRTEVSCSAPELQCSSSTLKLYYHGTIGPDRLPLKILEAIAKVSGDVSLSFAGYETIGTLGYIEKFMDHASELGIDGKIRFLGSFGSRSELLLKSQAFDVGWGVVARKSNDVNMTHMLGASNKVFDYMSQGLAVIVSCEPIWVKKFCDPGYGVSCWSDDVCSISAALENVLNNRELVQQMGTLGRQKIIDLWNYERQFATVLLKSNRLVGFNTSSKKSYDRNAKVSDVGPTD